MLPIENTCSTCIKSIDSGRKFKYYAIVLMKSYTNTFTDKSAPPFFILEMANNHMGDVKHGLKIIKDFYKITQKFDFQFAFKFQLRDIKTFIHPKYKNRMDIKYVKRFTETELNLKELKILKNEVEKLGYVSICTAFDENSVDLIEQINFKVIKIGSPSFTDWSLLERIAKTTKPIIASTGGASLKDIDNVVSFFHHRNKSFAIMHCVGEYPTKEQNLQLNQIDYLKNRYANVLIGFSTHEEPNNFLPIQLAIAKGAKIFERHVGIKTEKYELNNYSSTPDQIEKWLEATKEALKICGVINEKAPHSEKEIADLRQFQRGVFAKNLIKKGEKIDFQNTFFAFPNLEKQLVVNKMSKYSVFYATKNINRSEPILAYREIDLRDDVYKIVTLIDKFLKKSKVVTPSKVDLEISHHYGIEKFKKYGAAMITCVNRDYCKKLIIMLPGQTHPEQYHKHKEETFNILYGKFLIKLNGKKHHHSPGDVITIKPFVKHSFTAEEGGILEEISTTHHSNDSFYEDSVITKNKNRKTLVTFWRDTEVLEFG